MLLSTPSSVSFSFSLESLYFSLPHLPLSSHDNIPDLDITIFFYPIMFFISHFLTITFYFFQCIYCSVLISSIVQAPNQWTLSLMFSIPITSHLQHFENFLNLTRVLGQALLPIILKALLTYPQFFLILFPWQNSNPD